MEGIRFTENWAKSEAQNSARLGILNKFSVRKQNM